MNTTVLWNQSVPKIIDTSAHGRRSGTNSVCLQLGSKLQLWVYPNVVMLFLLEHFYIAWQFCINNWVPFLWLAKLFVSIFPPLCLENHHNSKAVHAESKACISGTNDVFGKTNPLAKKNVGLATTLTVGPHFVKHVFVVGFGKQTASETRNSCENTNHPKCWVSMAGMLGLLFQSHENLGKPTKKKIDT